MEKLYVCGVYLGDYSINKYNTWELDYFEKHGKPERDAEAYVCREIYEQYGLLLDTSEDVEIMQDVLKNNYNTTIIECFNKMLDGKEFFPKAA
jgi:hypothetical protein